MIACLFKRMPVILWLLPSLLFAQTKPMPVRNALKNVTKQFGTQFVYNRKLLDGKTTTYSTEALSGKRLDDVLKGILYPNNLVFLYISDNYYSIVAKEKLDEKTTGGATDVSTAAAASEAGSKLTVSGVVRDSAGPLPDVTVAEKGKTNMTRTASDGSFSITVSNARSNLVFPRLDSVHSKFPLATEVV